MNKEALIKRERICGIYQGSLQFANAVKEYCPNVNTVLKDYGEKCVRIISAINKMNGCYCLAHVYNLDTGLGSYLIYSKKAGSVTAYSDESSMNDYFLERLEINAPTLDIAQRVVKNIYRSPEWVYTDMLEE